MDNAGLVPAPATAANRFGLVTGAGAVLAVLTALNIYRPKVAVMGTAGERASGAVVQGMRHRCVCVPRRPLSNSGATRGSCQCQCVVLPSQSQRQREHEAAVSGRDDEGQAAAQGARASRGGEWVQRQGTRGQENGTKGQ